MRLLKALNEALNEALKERGSSVVVPAGATLTGENHHAKCPDKLRAILGAFNVIG